MTYGNTFPHPVKGCKAISKGSSKTRHPYISRLPKIRQRTKRSLLNLQKTTQIFRNVSKLDTLVS